ncbi:metallophosphoesterase [Echinicola vietnamensis]|uniref:Calcineurin-like phosphoesterase n=1 Tax=Echinicola vietnamensis (strain DSM 17526 / LMG 23754 / KMM 6221) TaxID=926556 RepID=L0FVG9_ECHVK|nr:metallophosphoesterase [Echinicola vietnamensis]AGA76761.1 Calcineurin-like phosphoesterase [Echinicola vietnamensis DSM 17526]
MQLFIIGDVHGCYHTFQQMLEHWDPSKERLIQVGDLIDRGNYSVEVLQQAKCLSEKYHGDAVFLRGNHEQMMIDHLENGKIGGSWLFNGGEYTLQQFKEKNIPVESMLHWLRNTALKWESPSLLVSHAGIGKKTLNPYDLHAQDGILWNRGRLKKLPKIQVIGHTPQQNGRANFTTASQHWNIDTGAYRGICLTGLKLQENGLFLEEINIPTDERDLPQ